MVERFEGDTTLFTNLGEFMPPHPRTTEPGGIVLDLTSGIQGVAASGHVASMLEMAGVAYVGSTPLGHALASDHVLRSQALAAVGIKTPSFRVVTRVGEGIEGLAYPVAVKSRSAAGHSLVVARDREALDSATRKVLRRQGPEAVVEQYIVGREIEVPLIGNDLIERLPLVEVMPDSEGRECPAKLDPVLEREIREMARDAYRAVGGRDSARVRIRLSRSGTPYLIAVDSLAGLEEGGPFEVAAAVARSSFPEVVERIVGVARERYRSVSDAQALSVVKGGVDQATDRGRASVVGS